MSSICCRVAASCRFVCPLSRRASHKAPLPDPSPGLGICLAYHTPAPSGFGDMGVGLCSRVSVGAVELHHLHSSHSSYTNTTPTSSFQELPLHHRLSVTPISSWKAPPRTTLALRAALPTLARWEYLTLAWRRLSSHGEEQHQYCCLRLPLLLHHTQVS